MSLLIFIKLTCTVYNMCFRTGIWQSHIYLIEYAISSSSSSSSSSDLVLSFWILYYFCNHKTFLPKKKRKKLVSKQLIAELALEFNIKNNE